MTIGIAVALVMAVAVAGLLGWIDMKGLGAGILFCGIVLLAILPVVLMLAIGDDKNNFWWWRASRVSKVLEHASRLYWFLDDYVFERYPELEFVDRQRSRDKNQDSVGELSSQHLRRTLLELRARYDALTRRIQDLDRDIGISTDNFKKGAYVEQRDSLALERDHIADQMSNIESDLLDR